ncbi:PAH1 [Acrasis kona]|uniref:PAH1 n=1 Tax=Acrasis kona TaxID=1008807 RepID=A0AAW2YUA6_9EUKA
MYNMFGGENEASAELTKRNSSGLVDDDHHHLEGLDQDELVKDEHLSEEDQLQQEELPEEENAPASWSESILSHINSEHYTNEMMTPCFEWINQLNLESRGEVCKLTFVSNGEMVIGKLYVWDHDVKIVISDVDGTITKSDVWGLLYTRMGKDYTHEGISRLYTSIHRSGYKFIYLTARPITQATATRVYIESIYQDKHIMPAGPVITTPNRLVTAMAREVIIRRPETFKIAMLQSIRSLFSEDVSPFAAGFGNRPTDCQSYIAAGVEPSKSYRINPKGELTVIATSKVFQGYTMLQETVSDLFPHLGKALPDIPENLKIAKNKVPPPIPEELKKKRNSLKSSLPPVPASAKHSKTHVELNMSRESGLSLESLPVSETKVDVTDLLPKGPKLPPPRPKSTKLQADLISFD